jgi:SAM-dependent methyltransferase
MKKLHFGCGDIDMHDKGYLNVDIRQLPHVDIVVDVSKPLPIDSESIDEILAESILEHIPHNLENILYDLRMSQTISVLREWHRILKVGGRLVLKIPNFEAIANHYVQKKIGICDLIGYVCGGGTYNENYHHAIFDCGIIGSCLRAARFTDVQFVDPHKYKNPLDRENSWEMGVIATK